MPQSPRTPGVDGRWAGEFVAQLRRLGVEAAEIRAALAQVETHCASTGRSAPEAFGDPSDYARTLKLPQTSRPRQALVTPVLGALIGVLGMLLTARAVSALRHDDLVQVTAGSILALALLVALGTWAWIDFDRIVRVLTRNPIRVWVLLMLAMAVLVIVYGAFQAVVTTWPATPTLVVGIGLVTAAALEQWRNAGSELRPAPESAADAESALSMQQPAEVTTSDGTAGGGTSSHRAPAAAVGNRRAAVLAAATFPGMTVLIIVVDLLLGG